MYWTLVVFLNAVTPQSIVIDGFSKMDDCTAVGYMNLQYVQTNPKVQFRCEKTGKPPVRCYPDKRTYGRTAECITTEQP